MMQVLWIEEADVEDDLVNRLKVLISMLMLRWPPPIANTK
jgi:hypothetical protein